jgi:hypothetical protein
LEFADQLADELARRRAALSDLIAKYPREVEPQRQLIQMTIWWDREAWPTLREHYRKEAELHPDDPLALYLAGVALMVRDTPTSVSLLETAKATAPPQFPWPVEALAYLHTSGKWANKEKSEAEIEAFFNACPSSTDGGAQWILAKTGNVALQSRVAVALRVRLAKETSPPRVKDYSTLWSLEFSTRPPQDYDALRKQVREDVKRLESLKQVHPGRPALER